MPNSRAAANSISAFRVKSSFSLNVNFRFLSQAINNNYRKKGHIIIPLENKLPVRRKAGKFRDYLTYRLPVLPAKKTALKQLKNRLSLTGNTLQCE